MDHQKNTVKLREVLKKKKKKKKFFLAIFSWISIRWNFSYIVSVACYKTNDSNQLYFLQLLYPIEHLS